MTMPVPVETTVHRLWREVRRRPVAATLGVGAIYLGLIGLILGAEASKAFTIIAGAGGGPWVARIMGAILLAGGVTASVGVIRFSTMMTLAGDALISVGSLIYGGGVLIGLHKAGLMASGFAFIAAIGMALRVRMLSADIGPPPPRA
jgi:hypothetical protein